MDKDAVEKLEAARLHPQESLSDVVRRAEFPVKPRLAGELLESLQERAGFSPLSDEDLDRLSDAQANPVGSPSHWSEH